MPRIAILGANGQVGAELCLLLSRIPGIDLVPVCRNPTGSAFLRYSGISCRHGRPADPGEAPQLFGDCDVIVNCALGTGTPSAIRAFDDQLIRNIFTHSRADVTVIHCSTLMIHGDPRPGRFPRVRDAYGRAKFAAEGRFLAESKRSGKPAYILRLGHVCGPLQDITDKIRKEVTYGQVILPEDDVPSNTVYTITIVDAIMSILGGKEHPGAFDLTNVPQWTWRHVYQYECGVIGQLFSPRLVPASKPQSVFALILGSARGTISRGLASPFVRSEIDRWLVLAPPALNDRAQAIWLNRRARAEIRALKADPTPAPELSWIRLDHRILTSLQPTESLLAGDPYKFLTSDIRSRWPKDLALAAEVPQVALQQE